MSTNIEELTRQLALARKGLEGIVNTPIDYSVRSRSYARAVLRALDDPDIEPCPTCGSIFVFRREPEDEDDHYRFTCFPCEVETTRKRQEERHALYEQEKAEHNWAIEQLKECWSGLEHWTPVAKMFRRFKSAAGVERRLNDYFWLPDRDNSRLADIIYRGIQDEWVPPSSAADLATN